MYNDIFATIYFFLDNCSSRKEEGKAFTMFEKYMLGYVRLLVDKCFYVCDIIMIYINEINYACVRVLVTSNAFQVK